MRHARLNEPLFVLEARVKTCIHGNFGPKKLRNRTAGFRGADCSVEGLLLRAGHVGQQFEMAFCNGMMLANFLA